MKLSEGRVKVAKEIHEKLEECRSVSRIADEGLFYHDRRETDIKNTVKLLHDTLFNIMDLFDELEYSLETGHKVMWSEEQERLENQAENDKMAMNSEKQGGVTKQPVNISELSASDLGTLLSKQYVHYIPQQLWELCHQHTRKTHPLFRIVCDCFNCGYILGKQAERRRNHHKRWNTHAN